MTVKIKKVDLKEERKVNVQPLKQSKKRATKAISAKRQAYLGRAINELLMEKEYPRIITLNEIADYLNSKELSEEAKEVVTKAWERKDLHRFGKVIEKIFKDQGYRKEEDNEGIYYNLFVRDVKEERIRVKIGKKKEIKETL